MKINIDFDAKSIRKAITQIKNVKKRFEQVAIPKFLISSAKWIIAQADNYITMLDIGEGVKADVIMKWGEPILEGNRVVIKNTSSNAVFLEFGVGIVGKQYGYNNTFNSDWDNYEYDVNSPHKLKDRSWIFALDDEYNLDISMNYVMSDRREHPNTIRTQGQPAQLYLFNALMAFINRKQYKKIWEQTLKSVIK